MAAIPAALAWVGAGLGISAAAPEMNPFSKNDKNNNNQHPPIYQIQTQPQSSMGAGSILTAVVIGGGVVVFFGAYKYFWGSNPLDKILPELEESSRQTLDQVRKADENSRVRQQQMDENNRQRLLTLRSELQGEQRGNFEVLSEQINCLTQIALQTLTTITPNEQLALTNNPNMDDNQIAEYREQRNNINDYARKAQQVADEIADPQYHTKKRNDAMREIRAEIPQLKAYTPGQTNEQFSNNLEGVHDLDSAPRRGGRQRRRNNDNGNSSGMGMLGKGLALFWS